MTIKRLSTRPVYLTRGEHEFVQMALDTLLSTLGPPSMGNSDAANIKFAKSATAARIRGMRFLFDWPEKEVKQ